MRMFAHTKPGFDSTHWEPLIDHLHEVAIAAGEFADTFGCSGLGQAAGWCHDLGKASHAFQHGVLRAGEDEADTDVKEEAGAPALKQASPNKRVDHSTAGARHAIDTLAPMLGSLIAYGIAGHHGRLPNYGGDGSTGTLAERLDPNRRVIEPLDPPPEAVQAIRDLRVTPQQFHRRDPRKPVPDAFQMSLLTRMLYSALIDADRLATEAFCNPERAAQRPAEASAPAVLLQRLDAFLEQLRARRADDPAPVDRQRASVLAACRERAALPPGVFSLTVPTGGGKTLASMAFALTHAARHGQRRVVYALPYTSIIEQTAATFREVFGEANILEHHSNLDEDRLEQRSLTAQMAAENFDAPVVVTTNVQLFESLFSAHGSTCRKLHRLAGSVIILDEAQSIPPRLLKPTLAVLDELVRNYRVTVVLCTATQPAIHQRDSFPIGLPRVTEIVPDPRKLYQAMQRVKVKQLGHLDDDALASRLAQNPQAHCIVNTRKHAAALTERLLERADEPEQVVHLSAAMCPQHRSELVADIKQALEDKRPLRVVSTQVIEAGVDVDFPVVYRALAGFDSIAQAAGRCNREGRAARGEVFVFETDHAPARSMRPQVHAASELLDTYPDPLDLDAIEAYFRLVYWKRKHEGEQPWDHRDVMGCFETPTRHQFRDADQRFAWIDSQTTNVIVPHGQRGQELVHHLLTADEPDWPQLRAAQRYSVSVYADQLAVLQDNTTITECFDGRFWVLNNAEAYDETLGLLFEVAGHSPDQSVI